MHASFTVGDTQIMASDGMGSGHASFQGISLALSPANAADAQRYFDALADGGKVQRELQQIEARQVDRAESRREVQVALAEAHAEAAQVRAEAVAEKAVASAPKVVMKCLDKDRAVTTKVDANGRTTMYVCESYGDMVALKALKHTRKSIASDSKWSDDTRAEILADIDAEIARLSR
ncbi:hypothetical protein [Candidatus Halocynthiibacter alkanivorans]|uniref:hypothetical protein n=1 Tax=Candidatus Halocynthiibacter alkanivorans TaxID=2267619 RepID=UPI00190F5956